VAEVRAEGSADRSNVVFVNAEGAGRRGDLADKVADFSGGEIHELVDVILGTFSAVGWVVGAPLLRALKKGTEVLVQVSEECVLHGGHVVGRLVLHKRSSSTTIEEVDGRAGRTTIICGC